VDIISSKIAKVVLAITVIVNIIILLGFLLSITAGFNGLNIGLENLQGVLTFLAILPITALSVVWLIKGLKLSNFRHYIIYFLIIVVMLATAPRLISHFTPYGWIREIVRSDTLRYAEDGEHMYRIELINMFQRNSSARIYIRHNEEEEGRNIPLDIPTREIQTLSTRTTFFSWGRLVPTGTGGQYILLFPASLPGEVPLYTSGFVFEAQFLVDVQTETATRIYWVP